MIELHSPTHPKFARVALPSNSRISLTRNSFHARWSPAGKLKSGGKSSIPHAIPTPQSHFVQQGTATPKRQRIRMTFATNCGPARMSGSHDSLTRTVALRQSAPSTLAETQLPTIRVPAAKTCRSMFLRKSWSKGTTAVHRSDRESPISARVTRSSVATPPQTQMALIPCHSRHHRLQ